MEMTDTILDPYPATIKDWEARLQRVEFESTMECVQRDALTRTGS